VSFGDSLIKRVVETLSDEFPKLSHFVTLSPIPGFRAWLVQHAERMLGLTPEKERAELGRAVGFEPPAASHVMQALVKAEATLDALDTKSPLRRWLLGCAAQYLGRELTDGKPLDPVARFHLGNGARIERLNWMGDPSPKGLKQSYGLMVNYLYDLKRLDRHRAQLAQGKIAVSSSIEGLLF
jgi:malonyl-CoA decarboxylase